jgi:ketosteroid isomerase-like protein
MPASTTLPGPHEVFEQMRRHWLGETDVELLADDAVIELPFALPGRRTRFEGREDFRSATDAERANFPVRFEEVRNVVIHDTTDPEVIVVEYELAGVVTTTGRRASATFIGVLRVRDGKTVLWREYQNTLAIAAALDQLPDLFAAFGRQ